MQRRKVLLPEPDGPMTHSTSPAGISTVMPLSAWNAPKLLHTSTARTMGSLWVPPMLTASRWRGRGRARKGGRGGGGGGERGRGARLQQRQHGDHRDVPDARHDQQLDHAGVGVVDVLRV